jgi:hypothetical protein
MLPLDLRGFSVRRLLLSLVDEVGNQLVAGKDETELNHTNAITVYALAHAILEVNGLLPPRDQKVVKSQDNSAIDFLVGSIEDVIRSKYPSWPREKIDEYRSYLQMAKPVFSFQRSYQKKYRPGTDAWDRRLPAVPSVTEEERQELADALDRLLGSPLRPPSSSGGVLTPKVFTRSEHKANGSPGTVLDDLGTAFGRVKLERAGK